jgi:hypothetical protein
MLDCSDILSSADLTLAMHAYYRVVGFEDKRALTE